MSVTRNTLSLLIASVAQKAIAFVYFALVARWAGVEDTGKYFFAISWTLMFSIATDIGLTSVLIRETARRQEETPKLLGAIISAKLPLMAIAALLVNGGVLLLGYPNETRLMVALCSIVLLLDAVSLSFYGVLRGHQMLKYEGFGLMIGQTLTLIVGVFVLKSGFPLWTLMLALIAGSFYNAGASVWMVRRKLNVVPKFSFDKPFILSLVKTAIPFALAGAFVKLYTNADVVLLNKLAGDEAAGLYSVPYKLTFAFQFIPMAFTAALYPAMSRAYTTDRARLAELLRKSMRYLALIVAPLVVGVMVLAKEAVVFVYGPDYLGSVMPLVVMIPTLIFIFLDFPIGSLLNGTDRQMTQTKLMGMAVLISVALNVILIPTYGVMGVAIASLVSHAALFIGGLMAVNRFVDWQPGKAMWEWLRIGLAACAMGAAVMVLKPHAPLPVSVLAGGLAYLVFVFLFRAFSIPEAKALAATILKRKTA